MILEPVKYKFNQQINAAPILLETGLQMKGGNDCIFASDRQKHYCQQSNLFEWKEFEKKQKSLISIRNSKFRFLCSLFYYNFRKTIFYEKQI